MSEKSNPDQNKYTYKYIQFTATPYEKKQIKQFADKENFKTTSEFVRRIVFDHIRKKERNYTYIKREFFARLIEQKSYRSQF
ncbi:MAG: hypothetical protein ACFE94_15135 [Candidatus Hodarchaeota archaeon]